MASEPPQLPPKLQDVRVADLPDSAFYVPNFITPLEEAHLLSEIYKSPSSRWTNLSRRRLLSLPSPLTGAARDTLLAAPFLTFISSPILPRLEALGLFSSSPHQAPNHVLINEYTPGQGIMPHEDGPTYHPTTATVSLGAPIVLDIYDKLAQGEREAELKWRVLQEPRSLLVTTGEMYRSTLHGIAEVTMDKDLGPHSIVNWDILGNKDRYQEGEYERRTRVSLTYRDVLKVLKVGGAMKFAGKR